MTYESFKTQLPKYFGHQVDFLAIRLFSFLAGNQTLRRIYFPEFLEKLNFLFKDESTQDKLNFVFFLLDWDQDGVLTAYDLLKTQEYVPVESKFGQEVGILISHYEEHQLKVQKPFPHESITQQKFKKLIDRSRA